MNISLPIRLIIVLIDIYFDYINRSPLKIKVKSSLSEHIARFLFVDLINSQFYRSLISSQSD